MDKKYNVDYFIQKFSAIPEDKWGAGSYQRNGKKCAYGHCGVSGISGYNPEAEAITSLFLSTIKIHGADINDGCSLSYKQPTPKQRILAALQDIKRMQEQQQPPSPIAPSKPEPRVIHHYEPIPESITKQLKETVLN